MTTVEKMAFLGANAENASKLLTRESFREVRRLYYLAIGLCKNIPSYTAGQTTSDVTDKKVLVTISLLI